MKVFIIVAVVLLFFAAVFGAYYFFIDTLSLSELTGSTGSATMDILIGLVDFDTGVTRFEKRQFMKKAEYYAGRFEEVNAITNEDEQAAATLELMAELMQEPMVKKLSQKGLSLISKDDVIKVVEMML